MKERRKKERKEERKEGRKEGRKKGRKKERKVIASSIGLLPEGSVLRRQGLSEVQPTWTHSCPAPPVSLVPPQTS